MNDYKEFILTITGKEGRDFTIEPVTTPDSKVVTKVSGCAFSNIQPGDTVKAYWIGSSLSIKVGK
ncbi:hypothetical protein [uncultured Clostridium sp.]|jgi:hypothetical protein|uniref:hypothetical protein n=1 Tax=uncultured Clostridium sp. TaxID=59620 RepID=UPI00260BA594|nr:hypothetical protein [uncultured Clostridium sp.]